MEDNLDSYKDSKRDKGDAKDKGSKDLIKPRLHNYQTEFNQQILRKSTAFNKGSGVTRER